MNDVTLTLTKNEAAVVLDALRRMYAPYFQSYPIGSQVAGMAAHLCETLADALDVAERKG